MEEGGRRTAWWILEAWHTHSLGRGRHSYAKVVPGSNIFLSPLTSGDVVLFLCCRILYFTTKSFAAPLILYGVSSSDRNWPICISALSAFAPPSLAWRPLCEPELAAIFLRHLSRDWFLLLNPPNHDFKSTYFIMAHYPRPILHFPSLTETLYVVDLLLWNYLSQDHPLYRDCHVDAMT